MVRLTPEQLRRSPAARERTCVYCTVTWNSAAEATACEQGHEAEESAYVLGSRFRGYRRVVFGAEDW